MRLCQEFWIHRLRCRHQRRRRGRALRNSAVAISNGLFTVALDFGAVFDGTDQWLQIGVRSTGAGPFTSLAPLQALTAVPYALTAKMAASLAGALPATQLSGTVPLDQLPSTLLTNGQAGVRLTGAFGGNAVGLTNIPIASIALPGQILTNGVANSVTFQGNVRVNGVFTGSSAGASGFKTPYDYGATGTGSDETANLQAWLNDASANNYIALLPPAPYGYWIFSNTLTIPGSIFILGAGGETYQPITQGSTRSRLMQIAANQNGLDVLYQFDNIRIENILLCASPAKNWLNSNVGIAFSGQRGGSDQSCLRNVGVTNYGTGYAFLGSPVSSADGISCGFCRTGMVFNSIGGYMSLRNVELGGVCYSNQIWVQTGFVSFHDSDLGPDFNNETVIINNGVVSFWNCTFESQAFVGTVHVLNGGNASFHDCYSMPALGSTLINVNNGRAAVYNSAFYCVDSYGFAIRETNSDSVGVFASPAQGVLSIINYGGPSTFVTNWIDDHRMLLESAGNGWNASDPAAWYNQGSRFINYSGTGTADAKDKLMTYPYMANTNVAVDLFEYYKDCQNGTITNGGLIWYVTNNTPSASMPNGSIATTTDGRFFVRSNSTWVLH